jgi:hypothetical protein
MTGDQLQIPACFVATCEFCGEQVDIRAKDISYCVRGWAPHDAGDDLKLSDFVQPEPTNRWAHLSCVEGAELERKR